MSLLGSGWTQSIPKWHSLNTFLLNVLCSLSTDQWNYRRLGTSDNHIFFLMKAINRLAIHLDKKQVFGMIVKSGYQAGRENLPIWQGQQRKEMKQHRAIRTPIIQWIVSFTEESALYLNLHCCCLRLKNTTAIGEEGNFSKQPETTIQLYINFLLSISKVGMTVFPFFVYMPQDVCCILWLWFFLEILVSDLNLT